jgi:hypothetical protein
VEQGQAFRALARAQVGAVESVDDGGARRACTCAPRSEAEWRVRRRSSGRRRSPRLRAAARRALPDSWWPLPARPALRRPTGSRHWRARCAGSPRVGWDCSIPGGGLRATRSAHRPCGACALRGNGRSRPGWDSCSGPCCVCPSSRRKWASASAWRPARSWMRKAARSAAGSPPVRLSTRLMMSSAASVSASCFEATSAARKSSERSRKMSSPATSASRTRARRSSRALPARAAQRARPRMALRRFGSVARISLNTARARSGARTSSSQMSASFSRWATLRAGSDARRPPRRRSRCARARAKDRRDR